MRAVITAAARSPRLLPLTKETPVSLLQVGENTILGHQLEALEEAGINDTVVITGFHAHQVEDFCRGRAACIFNPFYDTCNVALNLWLVRRELVSGFVLVYDDILFQPEIVKAALASEESILLVVDRRGVDKEAEKVTLAHGAVTAIGKSVSDPYGEFVGIAKFSADAIAALNEALEYAARADLETTFPKLVNHLVSSGQLVKALVTDHHWTDIDFPDDLEAAREVWGGSASSREW